ncbi:hypothetical protein VKT23_012473 [Stygiomarasmius scandens]|uniref:CFA20 domain-containing protein n=1 Tax=Marasmiellus scandens TaxID=2682957 RepID=A0ABR1J6X3_9AGAR
MFASSIQPGIVSLFSSTSSEPLSTFSSHADASLPSDSFIHLLDDRSSQPPPLPPAAMVRPHNSEDIHEGYCIDQTVLHMQSPTLTKTFIHCPSLHDSPAKDLALKHPWIYFQVRNLGKPWSFEIGIVDLTGTKGILRCSTFQKQPHLKLPDSPSSLPILHLPLSFPLASTRPLTAWSTVSIHIPTFVPHFCSSALAGLMEDDENDMPSASRSRLPNGSYSHMTYVRVYATCRLRRIWSSEGGPNQKLPWEFELYASE